MAEKPMTDAQKKAALKHLPVKWEEQPDGTTIVHIHDFFDGGRDKVDRVFNLLGLKPEYDPSHSFSVLSVEDSKKVKAILESKEPIKASDTMPLEAVKAAAKADTQKSVPAKINPDAEIIKLDDEDVPEKKTAAAETKTPVGFDDQTNAMLTKKQEAVPAEATEWKYQSNLNFVVDTTAQVLKRAFTQSKKQRGKGEIYEGQDWGAALNKVSNTARDSIYGTVDAFANSALGLTAAGMGLAMLTPVGWGVAAAGVLGGLVKASRFFNEENKIDGLKNNLSKMDKVAGSTAAVVGVLAGAVMAPAVAMALTTTAAVLGAGYMMEKVGEKAAKTTNKGAESAGNVISALSEARKMAMERTKQAGRG